jgi:hypothetical protein
MRSLLTYRLTILLTGSALFGTLLVNGCKNKDSKTAAAVSSTDSTTIQWLDSTSKDFGTIIEGQKLEVAFRFKNSGDKPLVIDRVQPSCGCTVAEEAKEPIAPGSEGVIRATFNSEGRTGINHKTLYVFANAKGPENALQFMVQVEKKP